MTFKWFILMSLLTCLSSSSFLFDSYFNRLAKTQMVNQSQIDYAINRNVKSAHQINFTRSEAGSTAWLKSGQVLSDSSADVSWALATFYFDKQQDDLGRIYLVKAAKLNQLNAITKLAEQLYLEEDYLGVLSLLHHTELPLILNELKAKALLALGEVEQLNTFIQYMADVVGSEAFIASLHRYNVFESHYIESKQSCPMSVTLIATTYEDLARWELLRTEYSKTELSRYLCIKQIRHIPDYQQKCRYKKGQAINCEEEFWQAYAASFKSEYLAVMAPVGKANVHYGILYLDRTDDIDVFKHELLHLLGFIDEYPLSKHHIVCKSSDLQIGHNLAVVKESDIQEGRLPINAAKQLPWFYMLQSHISKELTSLSLNQSVTNKGLGVFIADTCNNQQGFLAIRPTANRTTLTNHDIGLSSFYLTMLANNPTRFSMPSFQFNIARAYLAQNKPKEALVWLNKATLHRHGRLRKRLLEKGY